MKVAQDDRLPVFALTGYEFDTAEKINTVTFHNETEGDVSVSFFLGTVKIIGWGSSSSAEPDMNNVIGNYDDPNGHYVPGDTTKAAMYYKDQASPVVMWGWSVVNQNWFPILT